MTIPYAGVCVGSGKSPREGTLRDGEGTPVTGICPACSGRFELRHDRLPEHETAAEDERETLNADSESPASSIDVGKSQQYEQSGSLGTGTQGDSVARDLAERGDTKDR